MSVPAIRSAPPATAVATHSPKIPDKTVALFDGDCGFCQFQMRMILAFDWLRKIEAVPLQAERAAELTPGLPREELMAALHALPGGQPFDPQHKIRGARAVRCLLLRLPLLLPISLLLWTPLIYPAEWLYKKIARNRYFLSKVLKCENGACVIPQRKT